MIPSFSITSDDLMKLDKFSTLRIDISSIKNNLYWEIWESIEGEKLNITKFKEGSDTLIQDINTDLYDMVQFGGDSNSYETREIDPNMRAMREPVISNWKILVDPLRYSKYINRLRVLPLKSDPIIGRQLYIINNFYVVQNFINKIPSLATNSYWKYTNKRSILVEAIRGVIFEGGDFGWEPDRWPILHPNEGIVLTLVGRNRWRITKFFNSRISDISTNPDEINFSMRTSGIALWPTIN